jgi:alpha-1,6-mannosyltransferase
VAAAGPSLLQPALPGDGGQPPWTLNLHFGPYLAAGLTAAGVVLGAAGLALTLRAMRAGWTVRAWPLLLAGVLAAVVLSQLGPFGSSDFLSYAAYGRELVTGHNPYVITPAALGRAGDPVARAVGDWAGTPSVYGALANGVFGLASLAGGTSVRLTVWLLDMVNAAAFVVTGLLLDRLTRRYAESGNVRAARLRAALTWTGNPLLLQVLVAGAHVDALAVCFAVAGLAVASLTNGSGMDRGSALAAGALFGCGFAVKPMVALVAAGAVAGGFRAGNRIRAANRVWAGHRFWAGAAGFGVVAAADFLLMGPAGIEDAVRASRMVSVGSPWRPVRSALSLAMPEAVADDLVRWCAIALLILLVWIWLRMTLPRRRDGPAGALGALGALGAVLAWLIAWPYVLPWYDALGWALLPLPARASRSAGSGQTGAGSPVVLAERVMVVRTAMLAMAYLPARSAGIVIPAGLRWTEPVLRSAVCPAVLAALGIYLVASLVRGGWPTDVNRT